MRVQRTIWGGKERGVEALCDWIDAGFKKLRPESPYLTWALFTASISFLCVMLGSTTQPNGLPALAVIAALGASVLAFLGSLFMLVTNYRKYQLPATERQLIADAKGVIDTLGMQRFCGRLKAHYTPELASLLNEGAMITLNVREVESALSADKSGVADPNRDAILEASRSVEFAMIRLFLALNRGERVGNAVALLHEMTDLQTEIVKAKKRVPGIQGTPEDLRSRLQRLQDLREAEEEMDRMHASAGL